MFVLLKSEKGVYDVFFYNKNDVFFSNIKIRIQVLEFLTWKLASISTWNDMDPQQLVYHWYKYLKIKFKIMQL